MLHGIRGSSYRLYLFSSVWWTSVPDPVDLEVGPHPTPSRPRWWTFVGPSRNGTPGRWVSVPVSVLYTRVYREFSTYVLVGRVILDVVGLWSLSLQVVVILFFFTLHKQVTLSYTIFDTDTRCTYFKCLCSNSVSSIYIFREHGPLGQCRSSVSPSPVDPDFSGPPRPSVPEDLSWLMNPHGTKHGKEVFFKILRYILVCVNIWNVII